MNIEKYEAMAKISLSENERKLITEKMEELAAGFGGLEAVDTEGIEPLVTVLNITNVLREDVSEKIYSRDELLANAPEQYDGYFQIPKAL
jgi:aspartyl-tRNA(Asn)/glutamyl-tRNA(Gln) amidotransferase subunit C